MIAIIGTTLGAAARQTVMWVALLHPAPVIRFAAAVYWNGGRMEARGQQKGG
jgi:hypothetical protein